MVKVQRAILSVWDKQGIVPFAQQLAGLGVELVSTGGTAKALQGAGLAIREVGEFTGFQEMLEGRVKTLHPKIHGGILARRDRPSHMQEVSASELIDLVIVNLYPFNEALTDRPLTLDEAVERIDIGGVALLRAAAKNYTQVGVVCHPEQYGPVIEELTRGGGTLPDATLLSLAVEALQATSQYDAMIARYLSRLQAGPSSEAAPRDARLAPTISVTYELQQRLRYGENPHQQAAFYRPSGVTPWGLAGLQQLWGKELSYNNLLDTDAVLRLLADWPEPAACIVKHTSPCGVASAPRLDDAYRLAMAGDPVSAFGGIVGLNRVLDLATAEAIAQAEFLEVVVAPAVAPEALKALEKKKSLRVLAAAIPTAEQMRGLQVRDVLGGALAQEPNLAVVDRAALKTVTRRAPTAGELAALLFAWTVVKHVKSNAIVVARDRATVGIAGGLPSRVDSVRVAVEKAGARARGAVLASDAFFPRADGITAAAQGGVTAVIQPGGSIRDQEVIDAANRAQMAMVFTGIRHFKH